MVKGHTGSHILSRIESSRISQGLFKIIAHNTNIVVDQKLVARARHDFREAIIYHSRIFEL